MVSPALGGRGDLFQRDLAGQVAAHQRPKAPPELQPLAPFQPAMVRKDDESQEGDSLRHRSGVGAGMQNQPQPRQPSHDGSPTAWGMLAKSQGSDYNGKALQDIPGAARTPRGLER